jgi:hypothetical protein
MYFLGEHCFEEGLEVVPGPGEHARVVLVDCFPFGAGHSVVVLGDALEVFQVEEECLCSVCLLGRECLGEGEVGE